MPLGNGDIGLNVWTEDPGVICFYISKTDAWDENARLVKVGGVCLRLTPEEGTLPPLTSQELDLKSGSVKVQYGSGSEKVDVTVWVDANRPLVEVDVQAGKPVALEVKNKMWRVRKDTLEYIVHGEVMFDKNYKSGSREPIVVDPDQVIPPGGHSIGWYHHNSRSVGPELIARLQGVEDIYPGDPLLDRTFGAVIQAPDAEVKDDKTLFLKGSTRHTLDIAVHTAKPSTPQQWLEETRQELTTALATGREERYEAHKAWWQDFWKRSHIFITSAAGDSAAFLVTRGYTLQRFISACAGRGAYPIKFNGSLFTMDMGRPGGPDFRLWGSAYWWQNTRLPYVSMCASGDFEMMHPLFRFYVDDMLDFFRKRTRRYLGHDGIYLTEEMHIWGTVPEATYGWDSTFAERKDKLQESGYHKYEWVSGLELLYMMLDYFDYTGDTTFFREKVMPFGREVLTFFDQHYPVDSTGKMVMRPSQALETWWECTNPMPEIAGLYADIDRLLQVDSTLTGAADRTFWRRLYAKIPPVPVHEVDGVKMLVPAEKYAVNRNLERPEMYAVFPFRLYAIGKPHLEYAKAAMEHSFNKTARNGWSQDDIFYAYMGETEKAKNAVIERTRMVDPRCRFPAFWGPNFDWTPDQDHGSVLIKAVQSMLLQTDGEKIYLFPAWPKEWDVDFKLHAPYQTIIEGTLTNGEVKNLKVTPPARKKDVEILL
jgi:hypothetical protein